MFLLLQVQRRNHKLHFLFPRNNVLTASPFSCYRLILDIFTKCGQELFFCLHFHALNFFSGWLLWLFNISSISTISAFRSLAVTLTLVSFLIISQASLILNGFSDCRWMNTFFLINKPVAIALFHLQRYGFDSDSRWYDRNMRKKAFSENNFHFCLADLTVTACRSLGKWELQRSWMYKWNLLSFWSVPIMGSYVKCK